MASKNVLVIVIIAIFYLAFIVYSNFNDFVRSIYIFRIEYLIPVFGLSLAGMLVSSIRQQILLKEVGILIPFKKNILLCLAGFSMEITPGGFGKVVKSFYLKEKYGYDIPKSFPVIVIEKFYDLLATAVVISFTLFFIHMIQMIILIFFVFILIVVVYVAVNSKSFFDVIIKIFCKVPLIRNVITELKDFHEVFQRLTSTGNMVKNGFLSTASLTLYAFSVFFIFQGFNVNLDMIFTTFVTFSSILLGYLTFLPAGVGITEISLVGFLTHQGISLPLATSIMIVLRLVTLWFITVVGFVTTKLFLK